MTGGADPTAFIEAMREKWSEYKNVFADPLTLTWLQIVTALNYQAGPDGLSRWPVIPAELGIGKTTCAKLWCSMLPTGVSALVVVRTRDQAKEFADDVNAWSTGDPRAVALFSPSNTLPNEFWYTPEKTKGYPVVVVCHKSYELGLDEFSLESAQRRFDLVHQFGDRPRDIVIIDEALDQVAEARVLRGVAVELARVLRPIQGKHKAAMRVLESIGRTLREAPDQLGQHQATTATDLLALTSFDVPTAVAHLDVLWEDVKHSNRINPKVRADVADAIASLRRHLYTAPWTDRWSMSSARLLKMPEGTKGVILDATGELNNVYLARPAEFDVRRVTPVRDYSSLTIYEAEQKYTGKVSVRDHAVEVATRAVGDVVAHYDGDVSARRLLVVTAADKDTTQAAFRRVLATAGFAEFDVTNWGAVDGRNIWKHFDTLLVASLHYGTNSQDFNTMLAALELDPDEQSLTAFEEVRRIKERRIAASIAQAIGRLRLRTMTREDGTCEPCDVFVRLPLLHNRIDPERVMSAVVQTLPKATRVVWEAATQKLKRAPKRTGARYDDALLALVAEIPDGETRDALGLMTFTGRNARYRLETNARTPGNPLHARLLALGATLVEQRGRYVVKVDKASAVPLPEVPPALPSFAGKVPRAYWRILKAGDTLVDPGDQVELTDEQLGDSRSRRYQTLADLQQADGELVKVLAARRLGVLGERTLVRN